MNITRRIGESKSDFAARLALAAKKAEAIAAATAAGEEWAEGIHVPCREKDYGGATEIKGLGAVVCADCGAVRTAAKGESEADFLAAKYASGHSYARKDETARHLMGME